MVQLKIRTNFVHLKFNFAGPSLSDCLKENCELKGGLVVKGTFNYVSYVRNNFFLFIDYLEIFGCRNKISFEFKLSQVQAEIFYPM